MANTYTAIATVTVGSGGAANIDFTSIPATFTDLLLKLSARSTQSAFYNYAFFRINNDSTLNYSFRILLADYTSVSSIQSTGIAQINGALLSGDTATASTFSNNEIYIPNYAGSNYKSVLIDAVAENNSASVSSSGLYLTAGLWPFTTAIDRLTLIPASNDFKEYSTATLYGIKNS